MTYSNGTITVSRDGIYYIYGQIHYLPESSWVYCGFQLKVNQNYVINTVERYRNTYPGETMSYTAQVVMLNTGDTVVLEITQTCRYLLSFWDSMFGVFLLA